MKQALKDLDRVLDAFRDSRARSQESMGRQIRILAFELARRGDKPGIEFCLQNSCDGHIGGCTACWTSWAEQRALEEEEGDERDRDRERASALGAGDHGP